MQVYTEIPEAIGLFLDVALGDPLSLVLVAFGALFVGGASLLLGYLAVGGALAWLLPTPSREPPRQAP